MPECPYRFTKAESSVCVRKANRRAEPRVCAQRTDCRSGGRREVVRGTRSHRGRGSLSSPFPFGDPWRSGPASWPPMECIAPENRTPAPRRRLWTRAGVSDGCPTTANAIGWGVRACDSGPKRSWLALTPRWTDVPGLPKSSRGRDSRARSYNYMHVVCRILSRSWPIGLIELSRPSAVRERNHSRVSHER